MKLRLWFTVLLAVFAIGLGNTAFAFHNGGVAECAGCHSMHGTYGIDQANGTNQPGSSGLDKTFLLKGSDQSSTCLYCHAGGGGPAVMTYPFTNAAATGPTGRGPGGDFAWLQTASYTGSSFTTSTFAGNHGHNVIANDFGMGNNSSYTSGMAPSDGTSTFPVGSLHCNSCHDPHNKMRRDSSGNVQNMALNTGSSGAILPIIGSGSKPNSVGSGTAAPGANQAVGVYRILAGYSGYSAVGVPIGYIGVPLALSPSSSASEGTTQLRVAYGAGGGGVSGTAVGNTVTWSTWCATCHNGFDNLAGVGAHYHPVDSNAYISGVGTNYSSYVGSGNMTGNFNGGGPYNSLVPFMTNTSSVAVLAPLADSTGTVTAGPSPTDEVSCLTCHRAHASGFPNALRWDYLDQYVTNTNGTWYAGQGLSATTVAAAYYDRGVTASLTAVTGQGTTTFGPYQRSLCNKCHAQD